MSSPRRISFQLPMLVLEVSAMRRITTGNGNIRQIRQKDEGDWLSQLVADVQDEIAQQPSATAVQRIRLQLIARLDRPERAAA